MDLYVFQIEIIISKRGNIALDRLPWFITIENVKF